MEQIKNEIIRAFIENLPFIKIVLAFVAYSFVEYYFGKTDRIKEGSVLEFTWARIKGLFSANRGVDAGKDQ